MGQPIHVILPSEIIEHFLSVCDPLEVAAVAQASRFYRSLVYETPDEHLWRSLYLNQSFDDPRTCVTFLGEPRRPVNWRAELQRIIRTRTILQGAERCRPEERRIVLETLWDMVSHVSPTNRAFSEETSKNLLWVEAMLHEGKIFHMAGDPAMSPEEIQLCAKLHTHFGTTPQDTKAPMRVQSRAFCYDFRNYQWNNHFGPFFADGSDKVNWVHMQALHHVLSMHVLDLGGRDDNFMFTIFPMSLPFCQPIIPEGEDLDQVEDWAGVAGDWTCAYCFCDHRELLAYNDMIEESDSETPNTTMFEHPEFEEVFRSLPDVTFKITSTEHDPAHATRPKINFKGEMEHFNMSGYVKMTPDNQIRWHFVSGDQEQDVWSSEGIQVGGVGSVFGVLGSWTTVFHDAADPVGPFWLRRAYHVPAATPS